MIWVADPNCDLSSPDKARAHSKIVQWDGKTYRLQLIQKDICMDGKLYLPL